MIRFRLLGGLDLRDEDGRELRPVLSQPKRLALLAYLVAARPAGFHRRDTLLALFWPDLDSARARDALNQSLRYLRDVLGSETIVSRGADVGVDATRVWCDATAFRDLCGVGNHSEALDLYRGDFLTGFFVADSASELDEWIEKERRDLRSRASLAALALAERAAADGDSSQAAELARRAMTLEADSEASLRRAVVVLDRAGDRAAALSLYDDFARRLGSELDAEPAPETRRLLEDVRARRYVHGAELAGRSAGDASTSNASVETGIVSSASATTRSRRGLLVSLLGIACLTATAAGIYSWRGDGSLPDVLRDNVIVVAPVDVQARDLGLWREGIVDILSRSLDGAGEFRTVAPGVALRTAGIHNRVAPEDLARRTSARFVLIGSLQRTGNDSARLSVIVRDVARQVTRGEVVRRDAVERMDYLADTVAVDVLELLLGSTTTRSPQLRRVGTRSFPALKAFLQGRAFHRQRQFDSAETHFSRAIALDSSFALAYTGLADAASQQANGSFVREAPFYAFQAARFNRGLGARDSAVIAFDSVYLAAYSNPQSLPRDQDQWGHIRRAMLMSERLVADDPLDPDLWVRYAEVRYHLGGAATKTREREVMDAFNRAIALDSSFGVAYSHTPGFSLQIGGWTYHKRYGVSTARYGIGNAAADLRVLNELERAGSASRVRRIVDSLPVAELSANIQPVAMVDSDGTLMPAAIERIRGAIRDGKLSTSEVEFNDRVVRLLLKLGRYRQVTGVLVDEEKQAISFLTAAIVGAIPDTQAAPVFEKWLGLTPSPAECLRVLEWWARRGDLTSIERCAARRIREFQVDSVASVRAMAEPARVLGEAYAALARRDTTRAIRTLSAFPDSLCPVWCWFTLEPRVRLLAAAGRHRDAFELARYRSHIDFASSGLTVPMALARARLAATRGDPIAIDEYRIVAELWAHADPSLQPIVAEAKAALR
jgi:serine/threonine-protein kinase